MNQDETENIKANIELKKQKDKKKLRNLAFVASGSTLTRLTIYMLPGHFGGMVVEILWLPLLILLLALPFYGFEWLIDKVKKDN